MGKRSAQKNSHTAISKVVPQDPTAEVGGPVVLGDVFSADRFEVRPPVVGPGGAVDFNEKIAFSFSKRAMRFECDGGFVVGVVSGFSMRGFLHEKIWIDFRFGLAGAEKLRDQLNVAITEARGGAK
nr:hypothetical protein [uncultured Celeribacter sp.]